MFKLQNIRNLLGDCELINRDEEAERIIIAAGLPLVTSPQQFSCDTALIFTWYETPLLQPSLPASEKQLEWINRFRKRITDFVEDMPTEDLNDVKFSLLWSATGGARFEAFLTALRDESITDPDQIVQTGFGIIDERLEKAIHCNYSPPSRNEFLLPHQRPTPISSRCRVESNGRRDASCAASREAILIVSSGTLLTRGRTPIERARMRRLSQNSGVQPCA